MGLLLAIAFEAALGSPVIRVFEQAEGPILPPTRRMYTTRFDSTRTRRIGVELAATHAATSEPGTMAVDCKLTKPDGSEIPADGPLTFRMQAGETQSQSAGLLWGRPEGQDWAPGTYEIECRAGDKHAGKAQFVIARNPVDVEEGAIRVTALRIFPVEIALPPQPARQYSLSLAADETGRIGVEIEFSHAPIGHTPRIPVDCWFFWPDGQTSPPLVLSYEPKPNWAGGYSAGAMGFDEPGSWPKGVYAVSCAMHGRPVAVERFELY
jgi:hypothetical protein